MAGASTPAAWAATTRRRRSRSSSWPASRKRSTRKPGGYSTNSAGSRARS